jgi:hypothetical protein
MQLIALPFIALYWIFKGIYMLGYKMSEAIIDMFRKPLENSEANAYNFPAVTKAMAKDWKVGEKPYGVQ